MPAINLHESHLVHRVLACAATAAVLLVLLPTTAGAVEGEVTGLVRVDGGFVYQANTIHENGQAYGPDVGVSVTRTDLATGISAEVWRREFGLGYLQAFDVRDGFVALQYDTFVQESESVASSIQKVIVLSPLGSEREALVNTYTVGLGRCKSMPRTISLAGLLAGGDLLTTNRSLRSTDCRRGVYRVVEQVHRDSAGALKTLFILRSSVKARRPGGARTWTVKAINGVPVVEGRRTVSVRSADNGSVIESISSTRAGGSYDVAVDGHFIYTRRIRGHGGFLARGRSVVNLEISTIPISSSWFQLARTRRFSFGYFCASRPVVVSHAPVRHDGLPSLRNDRPSTVTIEDILSNDRNTIYTSPDDTRVEDVDCTGKYMVVLTRKVIGEGRGALRWVAVPLGDLPPG